MIIIAHRLSTVENCDMILWLEKDGIHCMGNAKDVLSLYSARLEQAGNNDVQ